MYYKRLYVLMVLTFIFVLFYSVVWSATYSIDSSMNTNIDYYGSRNDPLRLVRRPDGMLFTTYAEQFGTSQEIYFGYSPDDGINWNEYQLTNVGHNQMSPNIVLASNWDVWVIWAGRTSGTSDYDLRAIQFDYSASAWQSIITLHSPGAADGYGDTSCVADIDSDNNIFVAIIDDPASGDGDDETIRCIKGTYTDSTETWSWGSAETVYTAAYISGSANTVSFPLSIAVDQDDNVGVMYGDSSAQVGFKLRHSGNESWGAAEVACATSNNGVVMASISGGDTVWRCVSQGGTNPYRYTERASGSWSAPSNIPTTDDEAPSCMGIAQEHGTGDGDTGDFYAIYGTYTGSVYREIKHIKYTLGVGWGGETSIWSGIRYESMSTSPGSKTLWPYTSTQDWHWNMPLDEVAFTYVASGTTATAWATGDEYYNYYISGSWGTFRPGVITGEVGNITETSCTFNGTITYDGGANVTEIGWQYGHTQTATWTESQSGTFPLGNYQAAITGLEPDGIYYVRFYATNSEGTMYGYWIGFITSMDQGGSPWTPEGNGTPIVPVPTPPPGWFQTPNPTGGPIGNTFWGTILNPFFEASGFPIEFIWWVLFAILCNVLCLFAYAKSKHTFVVLVVGALVVGAMCVLVLLDWWLIFVYLAFGIALLVNERHLAF